VSENVYMSKMSVLCEYMRDETSNDQTEYITHEYKNDMYASIRQTGIYVTCDYIWEAYREESI